jgi:hypothetical protein
MLKLMSRFVLEVLHPIMTEGMSPYEIYYVLATDEEIQRLNEMTNAMGTQ